VTHCYVLVRTATTSELERWSAKHKQALIEVLLATDRQLDSLIAGLRTHLRTLFAVADSVAYIDMLQRFA
jgi:DNA mismatch repair ATPase MutS